MMGQGYRDEAQDPLEPPTLYLNEDGGEKQPDWCQDTEMEMMEVLPHKSPRKRWDELGDHPFSQTDRIPKLAEATDQQVMEQQQKHQGQKVEIDRELSSSPQPQQEVLGTEVLSWHQSAEPINPAGNHQEKDSAQKDPTSAPLVQLQPHEGVTVRMTDLSRCHQILEKKSLEALKVLPCPSSEKDQSIKSPEPEQIPNLQCPKVIGQELPLVQREDVGSQEEIWKLTLNSEGPHLIVPAQENGSRGKPLKCQDCGTEEEIHHEEEMSQEDVQGKSKWQLQFLEQKVVKVLRLWHQWQGEGVLKVLQQHFWEVEGRSMALLPGEEKRNLKVTEQQWQLKEKGLGVTTQHQERQDSSCSQGSPFGYQGVGQELSLPAFQEPGVSELSHRGFCLGKEGTTEMPQTGNEHWPIRENESSARPDQGEEEAELKRLEGNIPRGNGPWQPQEPQRPEEEMLQEQRDHQGEAVLQALQQLPQQEDTILGTLHPQCQVQEEAVPEVLRLQQQIQEKMVGKATQPPRPAEEEEQELPEREWSVMGGELQCQGEGRPQPPPCQKEGDEEMMEQRKYCNGKDRPCERAMLQGVTGLCQGCEAKEVKSRQQLQNQPQQQPQQQPKQQPEQSQQKPRPQQQSQEPDNLPQNLSQDEPSSHLVKQNEDKEKQSKKPTREKPNYFVAIPIRNDQILNNIENVQELIYTKDPELLKALISVQTLHITLTVVHLGTDQDVQKAISALEQSKAKVDALLQGKPLNLTFRGIGQFNNQVIYVKMSGEEQQILSKIADVVESSFREMSVDITGSKDFKPHLTVLKLSKAPALRRKGYRKISLDVYKEYEDSPFGTEILSQIDLCSMHKKKQESGYYHCECSIKITSLSLDQTLPMKSEHLEELVTKESPGVVPHTETGDVNGSRNCISHTEEDCDQPAETTSAFGDKFKKKRKFPK
ncbi:chromatin modification-related protein eaf-1-like [Tachyglossus aculeatus]|uniref:chromatin modification-related protein eaf-1-like n=1 Tax=Tachyglossus aculeatus TaxID=9261 RepID=UPI0018F55996|nr:chromatin modification-related protein eaf-1-like [Tachyglossus aculeatus]